MQRRGLLACKFDLCFVSSIILHLISRNINWSSPEILMDLPTTQITASADIWSLAMVISEICNGEVPYDSQECRQMSLDSFMAHLRLGHRPQLSKDFSHLTWLNEMVSTNFILFTFLCGCE